MRGLEGLGLGGFALGDLEAALGLRRAPLVGTGQGLPKTPIANGFVGMPEILVEIIPSTSFLWPRAWFE